jgi:hypothetical protein
MSQVSRKGFAADEIILNEEISTNFQESPESAPASLLAKFKVGLV